MNRVVKLILDTTAVAAFTLGSEDVGETIREIVDEDAAFAVPALCLAEAGTAAKADELSVLDRAGRPFALRRTADAELACVG